MISDQAKNFDAIQLSGSGNPHDNFLSVIVKKSYAISEDGFCKELETAVPLQMNFEFDSENESLLIKDTDLYLRKPFTDLIIKGHARGSDSITSSEVVVEVSGQERALKLNVFGKRFAYRNLNGKISFTETEPVEKIPLEYNYAYGGVDKAGEEKFEFPDQKLMEAIPDFDWRSVSPYRYPRNTCGKGYLVENSLSALEHIELPNIEDPQMLLTPSNLILEKPGNWIYQPIPRATSWVNPEWFPRIAYFGVLPEFDANFQLKMLPEYVQKFVERDILVDKPVAEKMNDRAANGASLGLQFRYLAGDESIRLTNIHLKKREFIVRLPNDRPRIWVDGRNGKLIATAPVIHTIVIEPDESRVTIVWRGTGPAIRPYHEVELKTMPYKVEWKNK
jgi:hypothetical protein